MTDTWDVLVDAAMAASAPGGDVHAVDTTRLRSVLREHGGYLPGIAASERGC